MKSTEFFIATPNDEKKSKARNYFASIYAASSILLGAFHLAIGSTPYIAIIFTGISIIGAIFIQQKRLTYSSLFIFFLSAYSGYIALLAKAILSQPLQQNLLSPIESTSYIFISFISISACAITSRIFVKSHRLKIGDIIEREQFWQNALLPILIIGFIFRILHSTLSASIKDGAEIDSGFGGFGTFNFVLLLGCTILLKLHTKHRSTKTSTTIAITTSALILLAIVTNTKKDILDFILLVIVSIYAFDLKLKLRVIIAGSMLISAMMLIISPAIHLMRTDFREATSIERLIRAYEIIKEYDFSPENLATAEAAYLQGFNYSYSETGSYVYPSSANIDRFMLILPVDQVARNLNEKQLIGIQPFLEEIVESILPSIFIDKDPETGADITAWKYDIRNINSIARPVIGFTASSLAAAGLAGLILMPWFFLFPALLFIDYIFGIIENRIWGVFGFVLTYQYVEKEIDQIIPFIFRTGPIIIITTIVFMKIFHKKFIIKR